MTARKVEKRHAFPWELFAGIPALAVALLCTLFVAANTGPRYDIVIINDHAIGGTFDKAVALALATLFGGVGIFALLEYRGRVSDVDDMPGR